MSTAPDPTTTAELQQCPRCWETAVNMTDPSGYKYRVCLGCGHVVTEELEGQ